jgi:hypothetical protein
MGYFFALNLWLSSLFIIFYLTTLGLNIMSKLNIITIKKDLITNGWLSSHQLILKIVDFASESIFHAKVVRDQFNNYKTTKFRDFCLNFGDYWSDLDFLNAVDGVDASVCRVTSHIF